MTRNETYEIYELQYKNEKDSGFVIHPDKIRGIVDECDEQGNFVYDGKNYKISRIIYFNRGSKSMRKLTLEEFLELEKPLVFEQKAELIKVK